VSQPHPVDEHFRAVATSLLAKPASDRQVPVRDGSALTGQQLLTLFDAQLASRQLDLVARQLGASRSGFYSIGSAGHEANAGVAAALRPTDPALLHYRSGGFYLARSQQVQGLDAGIRDVLLGIVAAADEPIAGGRHKVFGNAALAVIPQTSTIGSHPPRALGVALAIERARKLDAASAWPRDAITVCSIGDASSNHSTTVGALNAIAYTRHQGLPVPLLMVCEDNGIGISVRTPAGWVQAANAGRPSVRYIAADGLDVVAAHEAAREAVDFVRTRRAPVFLHLSTVRLMGHAGSDVESGYRTPAELTADLDRDPLLSTARTLSEAGVLSPAEIVQRYDKMRDRVQQIAADAVGRRKLTSAAAVISALAPRRPDWVAAEAVVSGDRERAFGGTLPENEGPLTLAQAINRSLADVLAARANTLVFGEDVARKGGVYGVTRGLQKQFGSARVFDTLLDEQSILGLALGAGVSGLIGIPEIQYLAYLHNAADQIRGEAATLQFFSSGQYKNPMVVRVAGYGYQKGFGGHFHNDNAIGALRDIPGLVIASPSRGDDAAAMLRTCAAAATVDGTVSVFLEPIALYHTRDLYEDGDGQWTSRYQPPSKWADTHVPIGSARTYGDGTDLTLVTFGNGVPMSLRVAAKLEWEGFSVRVLDLRWLSPLPVGDLVAAAQATGRVLVVDETRRTGGVSEGVFAALVDAGFAGKLARATSEDSFIPLGAAANLVLLSEETVYSAAKRLVS
jgi:2-oxoisovalerate dehydrogenase E1 component